jgi:hypothetical protein
MIRLCCFTYYGDAGTYGYVSPRLANILEDDWEDEHPLDIAPGLTLRAALSSTSTPAGMVSIATVSPLLKAKCPTRGNSELLPRNESGRYAE